MTAAVQSTIENDARTQPTQRTTIDVLELRARRVVNTVSRYQAMRGGHVD